LAEGATLGGFAIDETLKLAFRGDVLPLHVLRFVCIKLAETLLNESNVVRLPSPLTVVGDVAGYAPVALGSKFEARTLAAGNSATCRSCFACLAARRTPTSCSWVRRPLSLVHGP
jgi:hypothetical protein